MFIQVTSVSMSSQYIISVVLFLLPAVPILLYFYVIYWRTKFSYWSRAGVPHVPGKFPYGSDLDFVKAEKFLGGVVEKLYNAFPQQPYFGIYSGVKPILIPRDPEVVKIILAKEFSHFRDRHLFKPAEDDILSKHLFLLDGEKWRALRVKMSPVFTSGKLKAMFPLFIKCAETMDSMLLTKVDSNINVKDLTGRYSTDVIVSCAFGLEADSITNDDNPFRKFGGTRLMITKKGISKIITDIKNAYFPFLASDRRMRITPRVLEDFMVNTVRDTVAHREKTGLKRNDFIDLLISLKAKGNLFEGAGDGEADDKNNQPVMMTLDVMVAQCYVFFAAGYETSSSVKTFCLYELALNHEIQDRLRGEIHSVLERHGGEVTYQAVQEMEYLDMVVDETLRKYPTLMHLDRSCSKDFTFPQGHKIKKGTKILIPLWAIHHDPAVYPDPMKFDPERFTQQNKDARHPYTFLPFGEGPRICIGQRFGLLQTKMGLITFLRKYKVDRTKETPVPLEFQGNPNTLTRTTEPIVLKLTKI